MTVLSTPACRRFIAVVCRSVCGETFLFFRVGEMRLAVLAWLVTRSAIASRLSGRGRKFVVEFGEGVISPVANLWAWPATALM